MTLARRRECDATESAMVDLADYAEDLAAMRSVQDEIDDEARAQRQPIMEALSLSALADAFRVARLRRLEHAEAGLCRAMDAVVQARADLDAATEVQIQAMEAVHILRGHAPGAIRRALSSMEEQL